MENPTQGTKMYCIAGKHSKVAIHKYNEVGLSLFPDCQHTDTPDAA